MEKTQIDLNETMFSLCTKHPDLTELFSELGFTDITKPGMLQTAGRWMTPVKGAAMKRIPLERIIGALSERGYTASI